MRMTSFVKIIELQFPDVVCQCIDDGTYCVVKQIDRQEGFLANVGYISSWDHTTRQCKRTKHGSVVVTYVRNCTHKGIRTLAVLHGIKLLDTRADFEGVDYD